MKQIGWDREEHVTQANTFCERSTGVDANAADREELTSARFGQDQSLAIPFLKALNGKAPRDLRLLLIQV